MSFESGDDDELIKVFLLEFSCPMISQNDLKFLNINQIDCLLCIHSYSRVLFDTFITIAMKHKKS